MVRPISPWSDQAIENLKVWVSQGLSASEIANQLGQNGLRISRNAVIGKVHRLKLEVPNKPGRTKSDRPKRKPVARFSGAFNKVTPFLQTPVVCDEPEQPFVADGPIASLDPVTLENLQHHHCRALLGDARTALYCGNRVTMNTRGERSSYCAGHYARFNIIPDRLRSRKAVRA